MYAMPETDNFDFNERSFGFCSAGDDTDNNSNILNLTENEAPLQRLNSELVGVLRELAQDALDIAQLFLEVLYLDAMYQSAQNHISNFMISQPHSFGYRKNLVRRLSRFAPIKIRKPAFYNSSAYLAKRAIALRQTESECVPYYNLGNLPCMLEERTMALQKCSVSKVQDARRIALCMKNEYAFHSNASMLMGKQSFMANQFYSPARTSTPLSYMGQNPLPSLSESSPIDPAGSSSYHLIKLQEEMEMMRKMLAEVMLEKLQPSNNERFSRMSNLSVPSISPTSSNPTTPEPIFDIPLPPPPPPPMPTSKILTELKPSNLPPPPPLKPVPRSFKVMESRPSMCDVLKGIDTVRLKRVQKSPGGTPLKFKDDKENSRPLGASLDPAVLLANALKKRFAGIHGSQCSPEHGSNISDDDLTWTPDNSPNVATIIRRKSMARMSLPAENPMLPSALSYAPVNA